MNTLKAVTIDFEDWYQGIEQPLETWDQFEERIQASADKVLAILDETDTRATFFVLGGLLKSIPLWCGALQRPAMKSHHTAMTMKNSMTQMPGLFGRTWTGPKRRQKMQPGSP